MKIVIADLAEQKLYAPTLCAQFGHDIAPLNKPDGRPILMNIDNVIAFDIID